MGRRKGQPVHGWLIVDKPAGPSSAAVVARVRWALEAQKAGHAGTLDPAATGLLAVALGEATKCVNVVEGALKAYRFRVRWGAATDTDDAEGQVIAQRAERPATQAIQAALAPLRGDILQRPPAFSALKVEGARAYDLARAGTEVILAPRPLHVARLELVGQPDADHADFDLTCGKGGYVRAIARDLGEALGCLGHVLWLRRVWSGPFTLDQAVPLARIDRGTDLATHVLPIESALSGLPGHACPPAHLTRLKNGNPVPLPGVAGACWLHVAGRALALGHGREGVFHPDRLILQDTPHADQ